MVYEVIYENGNSHGNSFSFFQEILYVRQWTKVERRNEEEDANEILFNIMYMGQKLEPWQRIEVTNKTCRNKVLERSSIRENIKLEMTPQKGNKILENLV